MGPTILVMMILAGITVYVFLKFSPYFERPEVVKMFNRCALGVCAMLATSWYFAITMDLIGKPAQKYTPLLAIGGGCLIVIAALAILFLIRNFWIFKSNTPHWR